MSRIRISAAVVVLISSVLAADAPATPAPSLPDLLRAYSVIPPGQNGTDAFVPHVKDQLDMYASLVDDDEVTAAELEIYFHTQQFGPGATIEREYRPRPGVTVYRDGFGIPHVYGDTDEDLAFGLGYATSEDRMWHMDILRHAATGRLSEILGADLVAFDKSVRREGYSTVELQGMIDDLDERLGESGLKVQSLLHAYSDGVNARIAEIRAGTVPKPVEYFVRRVELEDWSPTDTVALTVFQLRDFGGSGGDEFDNAAARVGLRKKLGRKLGTRVFEDLALANDPDAYASVPASEGSFPSPDLGPVDRDAVAIPDNARKAAHRFASAERMRQGVLQGLRLTPPASNFAAVAPARSQTDNSLEWGAPQVGYSVPQFFIEIDAHSPSFDFRGPALPGASLLVPLGRGIDYAWSLTTGASDVVDARAELLCSKGDKPVAKRSRRYMFNDTCRKMKSRGEVVHVKNRDAPDGFDEVRMKVYRTVHGPVTGYATVDGEPIAITRQSSYWKRELDFAAALAQINSNSMDSVEEFSQALSSAPMSFNAIYVDDEDIAYYHAGRFPIRADGVDTSLPSWGTGEWEWQGFMEWESVPHVVNPQQGWLINWNNKPSTGWDNADHSAWGPTQRVGLIDAQMQAALGPNGKITLEDLVDVFRVVATQDARGVFLADVLVSSVVADPGTEADALAAFVDWVGAGAHRRDRDRDELQDSGAAVALFDTWYDALAHRVLDDELGGLYELIDIPISDDPRVNNGSSFFYDYSALLWNEFQDSTAGKLTHDFCDDVDTPAEETCDQQIQKAFEEAVAEIAGTQGADVDAWTWPADYIEFSEVGGISVDPIPWQNRGTYNHAIEVVGSR